MNIFFFKNVIEIRIGKGKCEVGKIFVVIEIWIFLVLEIVYYRGKDVIMDVSEKYF